MACGRFFDTCVDRDACSRGGVLDRFEQWDRHCALLAHRRVEVELGWDEDQVGGYERRIFGSCNADGRVEDGWLEVAASEGDEHTSRPGPRTTTAAKPVEQIGGREQRLLSGSRPDLRGHEEGAAKTRRPMRPQMRSPLRSRMGVPRAPTSPRRSRRFPCRSFCITFVELPLVLPPAVAGIGLLAAFGRFGLFGSTL